AKALNAATGTEGLSSTGLALGTPAYMAPEQAAADPSVDHRADLYAAGAVAYEMLSGRPPFSGATAQGIVAAKLTRAPEPLAGHRATAPSELTTLVMQCLATRPADRPRSATEVLSALEAIPSGVSAVSTGSPKPGQAGRSSPMRLIGAIVLFLLVGALLATAARVAALRFGLPDWVGWLAMLLLLIGLPIIGVTALLRHGPHLRVPNVARRWLTWRRTLIGGALAFALWGVVVAAYVVLRVLGIGPVGSLMAAGVLQNRERLVMADFENHTTDTTLAPAATEAFRIDLAQSPAVSILSPAAVHEVLTRMKRPASSRLDFALAREIAQRDGVKAVVTGDIRSAGPTYIISAQLVSAATGEPLAAIRETAGSEREILSAIDRVSKRLRERIGESLRSIQASEPLDRVTTTSMAALQKYSQANHAWGVRGDYDRAVALLSEAIELDSGFAMAYRKLGTYADQMGDAQRSVDALTKAYAHRDRLTERERLLAEGSYYLTVANDPKRMIAPLRSLVESYPDDFIGWNNLSVAYSILGNHEQAERAIREALRVDPADATAMGNLVDEELAQNKMAGVDSMLRLLATRRPDHPQNAYYASLLASKRGEYAEAESVVVRFRSQHPELAFYPYRALYRIGTLRYLRGRLQEGRRVLEERTAFLDAHDRPALALDNEIGIAIATLWFERDTAAGLERVRAALAKRPIDSLRVIDRPYASLVTAYAMAQRPDLARATLEQLQRVLPGTLPTNAARDLTVARGTLAEAEHRYADGATEFRKFGDETGCEGCIMSEIGRMSDEAGQPDSAIAQYERYLSTTVAEKYYFLDPFRLGPLHKRLGELYEQRGDIRLARSHYTAFVELWKDADPVLQPAILSARRALARISGDRPK
ncbi:MAG: protein kinase domain-containing protein, partial [Gemmatimonadaceae bacterium]